MRQTFITATIVGMLGAHSLDAQDSNNNLNSAQVTETEKKPPEIEARPQERDITAMADGGEWVEEYVSEDGEDLYQTLCSGCHMSTGAGAIGAGKYPALSRNPNLRYCPQPKCSAMVATAGPLQPCAKCPACRQEFCFFCLQEWHGVQKTCQEFAEELEKRMDGKLNETLAMNEWFATGCVKKCPGSLRSSWWA